MFLMSSVLEGPGPAPKYDLPSPQAIFEIGFFQEHPEARALRKGVRWHDKKSCSLRGSRKLWALLVMHHPTCSGPHFLSLLGGKGLTRPPFLMASHEVPAHGLLPPREGHVAWASPSPAPEMVPRMVGRWSSICFLSHS